MTKRMKSIRTNILVSLLTAVTMFILVLAADSDMRNKMKEEMLKEHVKAYKAYHGVDLTGLIRDMKVGMVKIAELKKMYSIMLPLNSCVTSSDWGNRKDPLVKNTGGSIGFHYGIDLAAANGTPVYACEEGTVVVKRRYYGMGNTIVINHGTLSTGYAHLKSFEVSKGELVLRGQLIGYVGRTGKYQTGDHLHWFVYNNDTKRFQNPLLFTKR